MGRFPNPSPCLACRSVYDKAHSRLRPPSVQLFTDSAAQASCVRTSLRTLYTARP